MITTKKGIDRKGVGVSFNSYLFGTKVGRLPKFQNQFGQGNNGQYEGSHFGAGWPGYIPTRMFYPADELRINEANYQQAVSWLGADDLKSRVWWDKQ